MRPQHGAMVRDTLTANPITFQKLRSRWLLNDLPNLSTSDPNRLKKCQVTFIYCADCFMTGIGAAVSIQSTLINVVYNRRHHTVSFTYYKLAFIMKHEHRTPTHTHTHPHTLLRTTDYNSLNDSLRRADRIFNSSPSSLP